MIALPAGLAERPQRGFIVLAFALLVAFASPSVMVAQGPSAGRAKAAPAAVPEAEVRAVVVGFSQALARGDTAAAVAYLHRDLVVYESGYVDDLAAYRAHHLPADAAFLRHVRVRTTSSAVSVTGGMALYTAQTESTGTHAGKAVHSLGTETMVLLRTPDGWKIRHIHWSSRR